MPILTVVSNIGEDVQYCFRCFNYVYDEKSVSHPDTIALLGNNYSLQIMHRNMVRAAVLCLSQDGPALICLKISARTA